MLKSKFLLVPLLVLFFVSSCFGEANFKAYETVKIFTCDRPFSPERIILNEECGIMLSPCYPNDYPEELGNGVKMWTIEAYNKSSVPVAGYRFTLNDFETSFIGGNLDFAKEVTFQASTNLNIITSRQRVLTIAGESSIGQGALVRIGRRERKYRRTGENVDIDGASLFSNFYASREFPLRGFNISYCADYDRCHPNYSPALCDPLRSMCVRLGFENYTCVCKPGYSGANCDNDIDECTTSPCATNAVCTNTPGSYICSCVSGYSGNGISSCEDINECELGNNTCAKNDSSICTNTIGNYTCGCKNGYRGDGRTCIEIDECALSNPCDPSAKCTDGIGRALCSCNEGYSGDGLKCEDINECVTDGNDCANDGTATCTNTNGSFVCSCNAGYTGNGRICQNLNECERQVCDINAQCTDTNGSYTCACRAGFRGDGKTACNDINECAERTDDCASSVIATCTNTPGGYTCACKSGYTGNGTACSNINECEINNPCDANAQCNDTVGSYRCTCNSGYRGNGLRCQDVDECADNTNTCAGRNSSICRNTNGSYICSCRDGYTGNGRVCNNVNECDLSPCDPNAACNDIVGSYQCFCNPGYSGNGLSCSDINECALKTDNCARGNVSICTNTRGGFTCTCREGYTGNGQNCTNIDECLTNPCIENSRCVDTIGSYRCQCLPGFELGNSRCQDINECLVGTHNCAGSNSSTCTNTNGSFTCSCNEGYTGNGTTCNNVNECRLSPCHANAYCNDTVGSYDCTCNPGYRGNGKSCTDINECTEGTDDCANNTATCQNLPGSYACTCNAGYTGNGTTCTDVDECSLNLDNCAPSSTSTCTNLIGSFACACKEGYTGNGRSCSNINECENQPCHVQATCADTNGSYICTCNSGYRGDGFNCNDIDECSSDTDSCAGNGASTCTNTNGSYICTCNEGFTGDGKICNNTNECEFNPCHKSAMCFDIRGSYSCKCFDGYSGNGIMCTDKNECTLGTNKCARNNTSTCTNTNGSYVCACNEGFTGDGRVCSNINECLSRPCHADAFCNDTIGGFNCTCNEGFRGNGLVCTDINECAEGTNDCASNDTATCTNTPGSYSCSCKPGFAGNGTNCTNINECNGDPCHADAICRDSNGGYDCTCKAGYRGNGFTCSDINECLEVVNDCAPHNTSTCTNTKGSYVCACDTGYTGDGKTCTNINECDLQSPCTTNAVCRDTNGSYVCSCHEGYTGNGNTNCSDIDECSLGTNNCARNNFATCTNTNGSFTCACNRGFTGDGVDCSNVNECAVQNPCHRHATCFDLSGSFNCTCNDGYTGDGFNCTDVNECTANNPCDPNASCRNTNGSYTCSCNSGFTGNGNQCSDINECEVNSICGGNTVEQKCQNLLGSYRCICNTPAYRGTPPNCKGYFCPGVVNNRRSVSVPFTRDTSCIKPGIIEWPNFYDGNRTYSTSRIVSWFVDFRETPGNVTGIKFTFLGLSVESPQDYVIFSTEPSIISKPRLAVFTGNLTSVFNKEIPANSTNPVGYNDANKTYIVAGRRTAYVYFYSDRNIVSTGFQMKYEPLMYVNHCPDVNPCLNGGRCVSGPLTYRCVGCNQGYEGQNCDQDINECTRGTARCSSNAKCINTVGGYGCSCRTSFVGSGSRCIPSIVYSNLSVTTSNNLTHSFLTVRFNVSEPWGRNETFIPNYFVIVNNTDSNRVRRIQTMPVNSNSFQPMVINVIPYTNFRVDVTTTEVNPDDLSTFSLQKSITPVDIISSSILPLAPTVPTIQNIEDDFADLSWVAPVETRRGRTIAYDVGYKLNYTDCILYQSFEPGRNCNIETTIRIPSNSQHFTLTDLLYYRHYQARVRAYTNVGYGPWTDYKEFFIGTECPPQRTQALANANPCVPSSAALISNNFPMPYNGFETSYWVLCFPDEALKLEFDYVDLENNQDFLDVGEGKFPDKPILTNSSSLITKTGRIQGRIPDLRFTSNKANNGCVFVRFNADLFNREKSQGFLIHYERNSSNCLPTNPCQNGGNCTSRDFDFQCRCTPLWTGKTCSSPLVRINTSCSSLTSTSVKVNWSVNSEWINDISAISQFSLNYARTTLTLPTRTSSYVLTDLMPYQAFDVMIRAESGDPSLPAVISNVECRTLEALPQPPMFINATSPSSDSIFAHWRPPVTRNGNIKEYRLTYHQLDSALYNESSSTGVLMVNATERQITGLRSYRRYLITVSAINNVGIGPSVTTTVRTLSEKPQGSAAGVVVSTKAREATLNISSPSHITGNFTYDIVYTIRGGSPITVTGVPNSHTLQNLTPYSHYTAVIYPRSANTRGNDSLTTSFFTKQDTPGPASQLLPNYVTSSSLVLTWQPPTERNGIITGYTVEWNNMKGENSSEPLSNDTMSYLITGLLPYTEYTFNVFANTSIGQGKEPGTIRTRTASAVTTNVRNLRVAVNPNNTATITFDQPYPLNGKLHDYQIQISDNETESKMLGDEPFSKLFVTPACIRGYFVTTPLPAFRSLSVAVAARTCAGVGPFSTLKAQTNPSEPGVVRNLEVISDGPRNATVTWLAPKPITGNLSYTVSAEGADWPMVVRTVKSNAINQTLILSGLNPETSYKITVIASTGVGKHSVSEAITLEKTPSILPGFRISPYRGSPNNLEGADPSSAHVIENPCKRKSQIFSERTGDIESINVIVKQSSAGANANPTVWSKAILQRPIPPYITGTIDCTTRVKRQVSSDGNGYIIGSDKTCDSNSDKTCNGPLVPGRTYQVAYQANNDGGASQISPYGGNFYIREKSTSGLSPGEIAAIIACIVLVILLIVLCIAFTLKRRSSSRSTHAQLKQENQSKREENPMYDIELNAVEEEKNPYKSSSNVKLQT